MSGLRRQIAAGLSVLAALTLLPRPAAAHALVLESSPRANEVVSVSPSRIFLSFNSRIEKALSGVTLRGPGGRPVPLLVTAPDPSPNHLALSLPALQPGEYLVHWKVLSADGHVTEGAFRFTLAPPP